MSSIEFTELEYKNYLKMDNNKHILVEGSDDSRFFNFLFEQFFGNRWQNLHNVRIDKAETLISSTRQAVGNREKIEAICNSVTDENFVGFVDREFRNFEIAHDLIDQIQGHHHVNRLVWSRGHSVENYFFDFELLRRPFQDVCGEDYYMAFEMFSANMENYLRTACLLSLTGLTYQNNIGRIEASITWQVISPDGTLDMNSWRRELSHHVRFTDEEIRHIVGSLPTLIDCINRTDIQTVRWLCHGHLAFKFLWYAFAKCIYDATDGEINLRSGSAQAFLRSHHSIRFNLCGRSLAQATIYGMADYPSKVFELLGIAVP
jgi:hypothetical protein